ncbi:methyltransferase domain-containing protein [Phenylobacterium sp. LjRoot219]|uniref:class I SAM-dependent methyltransferase n=1 Tax=Phenylobacterium sp. LjRoot219 TaxID=3342283 RepID=UPI003ED0C1E3
MARKLLCLTAMLLTAASTGAGAAPAAPADPAIAAAIAAPSRPAEDRARDVDRKPAEMLAFAEVAPRQVVGELLPGRGYFTRIFSAAVGPKGQVYAIISQSQASDSARAAPVTSIAADPAYPNVEVVAADFAALTLPRQADLVWTSQNYHDLHLARSKTDVAAVNRAIFQALKPGGLFIVVDHAAAPGAPLTVADSLHRIDPAIVRQEVEAAGFRFEGESAVLRNPADDHTARVFDPAIRGKTDQFVYKFRKPG